MAGISLKNPQKVALSSVSANSQATPVKSTNHEISKSVGKNHQKDQDQTETAEKDSFALPESLKQYFLITPCKLRLVVLLTLVMSKCRVSDFGLFSIIWYFKKIILEQFISLLL